MEECPENALTLTEDGIVTDNDLCTLCGLCAEVCPTLAIEMSGKEYSVDELMGVIRKEVRTIDESGGGVTISGGEPMMQSGFLIELLEAIGKEGLHRAVDTTGHTSTQRLLDVAKHTDLFLYDLKSMDPEIHKEFTGVSNDKILENLRILSSSGANINIRIPLIEGVNADEKNIRATAEYLASLDQPVTVSLLPYHDIARVKHEKLGQTTDQSDFAEPSNEQVARAIDIFKEFNITASIGG